MFHFCEMTRMIQAQSASLAYFLEIMGKIYFYIKEFIVTKSKSSYLSVKMYLINKLLSIKQFLSDFFLVNQVDNNQENESKIKNHITILDKLIKYLLISAAVGYTMKFVFGKIA